MLHGLSLPLLRLLPHTAATALHVAEAASAVRYARPGVPMLPLLLLPLPLPAGPGPACARPGVPLPLAADHHTACRMLHCCTSQGRPVQYVHGLVERSGFPAASFGLVAFNFIIHECPAAAIKDFVAEAKRLLPPAGVVAFVDNNPK